jgi:hypothetical protein
MKKTILTAIFTGLVAAPAFASGAVPLPPGAAVPEISALEGMAALAAVAALVLLAWERRRA